MSWTYRVIRDKDGGHRIAEVYTDDELNLWTEEPCYPWGDDLDELRNDVRRMLEAFDKPVLDEATLRETVKNETAAAAPNTGKTPAIDARTAAD